MTRFVTMRASRVGGPITPPQVVETTPGAGDLTYKVLEPVRIARDVAGKDAIFAVHGFNVSRDSGVRSMSVLEQALQLGSNDAFFGILWPGDFWIPVINYPSEARDAVKCGDELADFINRYFDAAASLSFVSHSLGGRLLLEAVARLGRQAREVCITAGAVDYDVLDVQYAAAASNASRTTILASSRDRVLKLAYPLGDFGSDVLFGDTDSPWARALGLKGPKRTAVPPIYAQQIPDDAGYDHGNYFPPGDGKPSPATAKWRASAAFMERCLKGQPRRWP